MADIEQLKQEHAQARIEFVNACMSDYISIEDYQAIRERYNSTMRAYHDALGYGTPVSSSGEADRG